MVQKAALVSTDKEVIMAVGGLSLRDVYVARQRLTGMVRRTPLIEATRLGEVIGAQVLLKAENLQHTGSFKIRGAMNKISSLSAEQRTAGVIAVSTGNHGRAVSHVARQLGARAVVCVSEAVPENKLQAIRSLGAELVMAGKTYDAAAERAQVLQQERGLTMVHPFDDALVIAGQGTIGIEILEDFPEIDAAVVPLSGGGLISGIGLALKSASRGIQVIGVTMERGPAMVESLKAGKIVDVIEEPTLADALAGGIGQNNRYTFPLVQALVDETVLVSEDEIASAMAYALEKHNLVLEGAGAVGLAALLHEKVKLAGKRIALVLSGGNVDTNAMIRIANLQLGISVV